MSGISTFAQLYQYPNTYIPSPREEKEMAMAYICDNCETPFKAQKKGAQDVTITQYTGKISDDGYFTAEKKTITQNRCPKCAIKIK